MEGTSVISTAGLSSSLAVRDRAISPTAAHVAAGQTDADVAPTNKRTPRHGASGRRATLARGVDRRLELIPLGAGDYLVVPRLEEHLDSFTG